MKYTGSDPFQRSLHSWADTFMHFAMHGILSKARQRNLSLSQLVVLFRLHHDESCAMADLSGMLGVSGPAASQLTDRMVSFGLLDRSEDEHDRRAKRLRITPEGDRFVHEIFESRQRWLGRLSEMLTPEERAAATDVLTVLADRMNQIARKQQ